MATERVERVDSKLIGVLRPVNPCGYIRWTERQTDGNKAKVRWRGGGGVGGGEENSERAKLQALLLHPFSNHCHNLLITPLVPENSQLSDSFSLLTKWQ